MGTNNEITIFNYRQVEPLLAIGGQPGIGQFSQLKEDGFDVVFQIIVRELQQNVANEVFHVKQNQMKHVTIEMSYHCPDVDSVLAFFRVMDDFAGTHEKMFVHCSTGFCTSTLLMMYKMVREALDFDVAAARYSADSFSYSEQWLQLFEDVRQKIESMES